MVLVDRNWAAGNSTYKKLAVQWLNEALCFVSSFMEAESLLLRNPLLRQSENRYVKPSQRTY